MDRFPSLPEHIEILARIQRLKLRRLVFRKATPMQDFFLPSDAQSMLDTYEQLGIKVYWYNDYIMISLYTPTRIITAILSKRKM